jgi:hypothetical protein
MGTKSNDTDALVALGVALSAAAAATAASPAMIVAALALWAAWYVHRRRT